MNTNTDNTSTNTVTDQVVGQQPVVLQQEEVQQQQHQPIARVQLPLQRNLQQQFQLPDILHFSIEVKKSIRKPIVGFDIEIVKNDFTLDTLAQKIVTELKENVEYVRFTSSQNSIDYDRLVTLDSVATVLRIQANSNQAQKNWPVLSNQTHDQILASFHGTLESRARFSGRNRNTTNKLKGMLLIDNLIPRNELGGGNYQRSTHSRRVVAGQRVDSRIAQGHPVERERGMEYNMLVQNQSRSREEIWPWPENQLRNTCRDLDRRMNQNQETPATFFDIPVQIVTSGNDVENRLLRFNRQDLKDFYEKVYPILFPERMQRPLAERIGDAEENDREAAEDDLIGVANPEMPDLDHAE